MASQEIICLNRVDELKKFTFEPDLIFLFCKNDFDVHGLLLRIKLFHPDTKVVVCSGGAHIIS